MTQLKKARLSAAVAAALGGAALSVAPLSGQAQDTNAPEGFSATGTGQVVIIPYYTVNGSWHTNVGITNTTDHALLVKVRVHEAQNSRDVLDFNVMLSPYDMWGGYLRSGFGDDAAPLFIPVDNSCTAPAMIGAPIDELGGVVGAELNNAAFTGSYSDGGNSGNDRLTEGYIEFLVIGECRRGESCFDAGGIAYLTEHVDGVPRDCTTAARRSANVGAQFPDLGETFGGASNMMAFATTSSGQLPANLSARAGSPPYAGPVAGVYTLPDARTVTLPDGTSLTSNLAFSGAATGEGWGGVRHPAPLRGAVSYINSAFGFGGGAEALHLDSVVCSGLGDATFDNAAGGPDTVVPDCFVAADGTILENNVLATAQYFDFFLEPTIATMPMGTWDVQGLGALEARFTWSNIFNEWFDNANTDTYSDWVINFPTKGYHVDQFCSMVQANNNAWRNDGTNVLNCSIDNEARYIDGAGGNSRGRRATPFAAQLAPFDNYWAVADGDTVASSVIEIEYLVYDREEGTAAGGGPILSPSGRTPVVLPYETNVIRFAAEDVDPLQSAISYPLPARASLNSDAVGGWVDMFFPQTVNIPGVANPYTGLPVYGFSFLTQQVNDLGQPFPTGVVSKHGYKYDK